MTAGGDQGRHADLAKAVDDVPVRERADDRELVRPPHRLVDLDAELRSRSCEQLGLRVEADFIMSPDRPARVDTITLRLLVPQPLESKRRRALLAVVDHCTVHNSIRIPPEVRVTLAESVETSPRHSVTRFPIHAAPIPRAPRSPKAQPRPVLIAVSPLVLSRSISPRDS